MYQGKFGAGDKPTIAQKRAGRKKGKRVRVGTVVFYTIYLLLILAFVIGMSFALKALQGWLVDFEASQPDHRSQEMFQRYFADPDWTQLYQLAGLQDTPFEGQYNYCDYMEKTVGDAPITMVETSAGLSGGKKYVIRAGVGEETWFNFATFTLVDEKAEGDIISDWQMGQVELFTFDPEAPQNMGFQRERGYRFLVTPECTVCINDVTLDESYIQRTQATVAEGYLPEGVHGWRMVEYYVDGLLTQPVVKVLDESGLTQELTYDEVSGTFLQAVAEPEISGEAYDTVLTAAQVYCKYMIGAAGSGALRDCFDASTEIYKTITTNTTWMQNYKGYDFGQESITDYYAYTDDLYSAKVTLALNVTRPDGTVKVYELSSTFFMERQDSGWRAIEMTNVDVQEKTAQVRVTYVDGDKVLLSQLVDGDSKRLTPPQITVPEGQTFLGWYVEAGRLDTGDDGVITLPSGFQLEPMTVYALFGAQEG